MGGTIVWISAGAVIIDRFLKVLIEQPGFAVGHVGWPLLGFERFHNPGVAFGIPVPPALAIPATLLFLLALFLWTRRGQAGGAARVWLVPIFLGAISNLVDRALFNVTLDYFRILYSIINIADILVLAGMVGLLLTKHKNH